MKVILRVKFRSGEMAPLTTKTIRGNGIALSGYMKKLERSHITNFTTHLKALEKQEVMSKKYKPEEIIKLRNEIKEVETQKCNESIK